MIILNIPILYYKYLYFSSIFSQSLQSLTLTKPKMYSLRPIILFINVNVSRHICGRYIHISEE
jgi:hypothetical protein